MLHFKMVEAKVEVLGGFGGFNGSDFSDIFEDFLENLVEEEATREVRATEVQI